MRRLSILVLPFCLSIALAQTPPQLSPQAAYDQAITPVDITRRSQENWSDVEKAALDVAIKQAKDACLARTSVAYAGDDLIAYARLCDLGQQWPIVLSSATAYINSKDTPRPQLDQAYAYTILANLNLQQWKAASTNCFAMLHAIPYGPLPDNVLATAIRSLQFAFLADALDLQFQRQPHLLGLIRSSSSIPSMDQSNSQRASAHPIPLHTLFEHALDLAALQQYNNQPDRAVAALADIDRAMPADLPADEAILIAADRRQYALLGTRFPVLPGAIPLWSGTAPHHVTQGDVNIFLLFPPWCGQCLRQQHEMGPALLRLAGSNVHMYGLLADDSPQPKPIPRTAASITRHSAQPSPNQSTEAPDKLPAARSSAEQLRGTPTLIVAPSTLTDFNATDFPFLIATDSDGIIRLMVPAAPANSLVKDGPINQIIDTIITNWPPSRKNSPSPSK